MTDVAKIANAVSRPRIDPRTFVTTGVITAVDVTDKGVHVDVTTINGIEETAAVAPPYGGPGYGLHLPVDLDHVAVIAVPDGVFNAGARVVGMTWDEGDPPPTDAIEHPEDVVLVVKPDQHARIIVSGEGSVVIEARGGPSATLLVKPDGTIEVGAGPGAQRTIMGDPYRPSEDTMLTLMSAAWSLLLTNPTISAWAAALPAPAQTVLAGFVGGITAFQAGAASYLTTVAKVS